MWSREIRGNGEIPEAFLIARSCIFCARDAFVEVLGNEEATFFYFKEGNFGLKFLNAKA